MPNVSRVALFVLFAVFVDSDSALDPGNQDLGNQDLGNQALTGAIKVAPPFVMCDGDRWVALHERYRGG